MSTLASLPELSIEPCRDPADAVRNQVWDLLAGIYPTGVARERRAEQRFPFPYLVHLNRVADDGMTAVDAPIVVIGKHLSERGLGFYHPVPLPYRRMIVSLEKPADHWIGFLIDLTWCRFTRYGWYDSGGRFLQAVESPLNGRFTAEIHRGGAEARRADAEGTDE